jgi:hypothetical protein
MHNNFDPNTIYQKLISAGEAWANSESFAGQLEELKKPLLAQLKLSSPEKTDAAKETWALAQEEYRNHIEGMVAARKDANIKKVRYKAAEAWVDAKRTEQATRRVESRLSGVQT